MKALRIPFLLAPLALALSACALLPDRPAAESPVASTPALEKSLTGFAASAAQWPAQQWWHGYGDAQLDALMTRALRDQPTLAIAASRVAIAEQQIALARAGEAVHVGLDASVSRARISEHGLFAGTALAGASYTEGDIGLGASYDLDFWGKNRAAIAASLGEANAARAEAADAERLLARALVSRYQIVQTEFAQARLLNELIVNLENEKSLLAKRLAAGLVASTPLEQLDARLAEARQQLKAQELAIATDKQALGLLTGGGPDAGDAVREAKPAAPLLAGVPARLSLDLLGHRPDLAAQRWSIEAASEDVKVAEAAFYPDINLTAFIGLQGIPLHNVLDSGSHLFNLAPALSLPLFDGGARAANLAIRDEQYRLALTYYKQLVLTAANEVVTAATQMHNLAEQRQEREQALARIQSVAHQRQLQLAAGLTDRSAILASERDLLTQRLALTQIDDRQHLAAIALISALGGGWQAPTTSTETDQ